jgi:hypothetical protein
MKLPDVKRELERPRDRAMWPTRLFAYMTLKMEQYQLGPKVPITLPMLLKRCRLLRMHEAFLEYSRVPRIIQLYAHYVHDNNVNPFSEGGYLVNMKFEGRQRLGISMPMSDDIATEASHSASSALPGDMPALDKMTLMVASDEGMDITTAKRHFAEIRQNEQDPTVEEADEHVVTCRPQNPNLKGVERATLSKGRSRDLECLSQASGKMTTVSRRSTSNVSSTAIVKPGPDGSPEGKSGSRAQFDRNLHPYLFWAKGDEDSDDPPVRRNYQIPNTPACKKLCASYRSLDTFVCLLSENDYDEQVTTRQIIGLMKSTHPIHLTLQHDCPITDMSYMAQQTVDAIGELQNLSEQITTIKDSMEPSAFEGIQDKIRYFKKPLERRGLVVSPQLSMFEVWWGRIPK